VSDRRPDLPPALDAVIAQGMAKDPWSRPALAGELIQSASRALSSSTSTIVLAPPPRDGVGERERRAQTTKVPAVSSTPSAAQASPAPPADPETEARRDITRAVLRPVTAPVPPSPEPATADAPSPEPATAEAPAPEPATADAALSSSPAEPARVRIRDQPMQLVALIVALTVAAFAAGFVLGLIVH
jgi:serine/threonine-protein kinase